MNKQAQQGQVICPQSGTSLVIATGLESRPSPEPHAIYNLFRRFVSMIGFICFPYPPPQILPSWISSKT